jgi:hypothetical protein
LIHAAEDIGVGINGLVEIRLPKAEADFVDFVVNKDRP